MGKRVGVVASAFGLLVALVVATGALATGSGTQFTACLNERGSLTRVAEGPNPARPCNEKRGQQAVTWNSEGPQGVAGPAGADGAQGDQGEKGDTGNPGTDGLPGTDGGDGQSCTVEENPGGTFTMTCADGSQVGWIATPTSTTTTSSIPAPGGKACTYGIYFHPDTGHGGYALQWLGFDPGWHTLTVGEWLDRPNLYLDSQVATTRDITSAFAFGFDGAWTQQIEFATGTGHGRVDYGLAADSPGPIPDIAWAIDGVGCERDGSGDLGLDPQVWDNTP